MADQLATPEDLASLLERDDVDLYKAIMVIECATGVVQAVTGQHILQVVDDVHSVELDELDRSRYIDLPERPVTAVSSVTVNALPITDYRVNKGRLWRPDGWRLAVSATWMNAPYSVVVTYTHGYPPGHQKLQLARSAVLSLLRSTYGNVNGVKKILIDDYEVQWDTLATRMDSSPFMVAALKRQYSRPPRSAVLTR